MFINVIINNNISRAGGGIYNSGNPLTFINVIISNNIALEGNNGQGGGIYFDGFSECNFDNVTIIENTSKKGGGAYFNESGCNFENVIINDNMVDGEGGGIYYKEHPSFGLTWSNGSLSGNSARSGGGLHSLSDYYGNLYINNITISENIKCNTCDYIIGGAMSLYDSNPTIANVTISRNENYGIYLNWSYPILFNTILWDHGISIMGNENSFPQSSKFHFFISN